MKVCVPKENTPGERRTALIPEVAAKLVEAGFEVLVESGAGAAAYLPDSSYEDVGAKIGGDVIATGDVIAKVRAPSQDELAKLRQGSVLIGFLSPLNSPELVKSLVSGGVTSFAMDAMPRTTRAQSMDALSSQALCAGYRAGLAAARLLGKFFPMNITAAGTAKPARVVVLGAGVAGLQAIATAKRLGAVVEAYDLRPAVKEEVESLGAKFIQINFAGDEAEGGGSGQYARELTPEQQRQQQELLAERVAAADCAISTAAVPGRPAPKIVSRAMVESMSAGSVVVDLAAETGGNCELTQMGEIIEHNGVTIDGTCDLPSQMPFHASLLYSNNVANLLKLLAPEAQLNLDFEDEVIAGACITHDGKIVNDRVKQAVDPQVDRPVTGGTVNA
ncbi:MAG: Re/Si-specific NAD(P)(+) transhydrogenase subunit alpha [Solirubrobacterales bacterium]